MLVYFIVATLGCLSLALWPHRQARAVEARIKEGDDDYFEEQRTYQAYPWLRDPKRLRVAGVVGTMCGLIACALEISRG
jgi:hypothetical protein